MDKFLFAGTFLKLASKGSFFRMIIATVLRVAAVLIAIGGVLAFVEVFRFITQLPTSALLGGIVFEALLIVAVYIVVHIQWIRAGDIAQLPESNFNVIPIVAVLLKMWGEIYSCAGAVIAVGAGVFIWFAGPEIQGFLQQALPLFPSSTSTNQSFMAGLMVMIYGLAICFSVLVFSYFVSEMILLGVQIERNTSGTLQVVKQNNPRSGVASAGQARPETGFTKEPQPARDSVQRAPLKPTLGSQEARCPHCGAQVEYGSRFCESCGTTLA
ncbi:MAG TPA: zinc ribbon domain-containing protein [Terriglobia bacterium]|nr:zinc ribbon domain-containing protein [Terriglobia bacterium]